MITMQAEAVNHQQWRHQRFEELVKTSDYHLNRYWDFETGSCDIDRLEHDILLLSGDEQIQAHFFWTIWTGKMPFEQVENIHRLNENSKTIVRQWSEHPFFL